MSINIKHIIVGFLVWGLSSCYDPYQKSSAESVTSSTGYEYAPQMYHSIPYEDLTQITDTSKYGYNSAPHYRYRNDSSSAYRGYQLNMRPTVSGSIARDDQVIEWRYKKGDKVPASIMIPVEYDNPKNGEVLFGRFCSHCHGKTMKGDGPVSKKFAGIANLMNSTNKALSPGHIFNVITNGKGKMGAHKSQVNVKERWEIVSYVKKYQSSAKE